MCEQRTATVANQNSRPFVPSSTIVPDVIAEKYLALQNQNPKKAASIVEEVLRKLERRGPGGELKYDDSDSEFYTHSVPPMSSSEGFGGRQQLFLKDKQLGEVLQQSKDPKPDQAVLAIVKMEESNEPGLAAEEAELDLDGDICRPFEAGQRKEPGIPAKEAGMDWDQDLSSDSRRNWTKEPEPQWYACAPSPVDQRKQPDTAKEPKRNGDVVFSQALHPDVYPSAEVDKRAQPHLQARTLEIEPYRGTVAGPGPGPGIPPKEVGIDRDQDLCQNFRGNRPDHPESHRSVCAPPLRADQRRQLDPAKESKRDEDVDMCSALHQDACPSGEADRRAQPQPPAQLLQIEPYRGKVAGSNPDPSGGVVEYRGALDDHVQSLRADLKRRLIRTSGGEYALELFDHEAWNYMSENAKWEEVREDMRLSMALAEERTQHLKSSLALHQGRLRMREALLEQAKMKYFDILRRKPFHPMPEFTYTQYIAWKQWVTDLEQHLQILGRLKHDLKKQRSHVTEVEAGLGKAFEEQKRVAKKMLQLDDNTCIEPVQETRRGKLTRKM